MQGRIPTRDDATAMEIALQRHHEHKHGMTTPRLRDACRRMGLVEMEPQEFESFCASVRRREVANGGIG